MKNFETSQTKSEMLEIMQAWYEYVLKDYEQAIVEKNRYWINEHSIQLRMLNQILHGIGVFTKKEWTENINRFCEQKY